MNSVAIRILALSVLGAMYFGAPYLAYGTSTGACHQTCTAVWYDQRTAAMNSYVACKTGCSKGSSACRAQCFQEKNAALFAANATLKQCFRTCLK
jgi:hypothetical protein